MAKISSNFFLPIILQSALKPSYSGGTEKEYIKTLQILNELVECMIFYDCGASLNETCSQCMQVHHTLQSIDCAKYTVQCVYWTPCVCLLQPGGINDEESTISMAITTEITHGLTSAAMGGTAWQQ